MFTYLLIAYMNGSMVVIGQYDRYMDCQSAAAQVQIQTGARAECIKQ